MFKFVLEKPGKCFESEKMRKIAAEEFYNAYCRLLVANLTKNYTLSWTVLIHFAIKIDFPCYQITLLIARYGF